MGDDPYLKAQPWHSSILRHGCAFNIKTLSLLQANVLDELLRGKLKDALCATLHPSHARALAMGHKR